MEYENYKLQLQILMPISLRSFRLQIITDSND